MSSAAEWNLLVEARWWAMEAVKHPEMVMAGLGLMGVGLMAFSTAQKRWLKRRDGDRCQLPGFNGIQCGGGLEEDHIIPQRYARETLGMPEEEIDSKENGITLCENHHRGHPNSKHPDAFEALNNYRAGDKDAFKNMGKTRTDNGSDDYWNETFDAPESAVVVRNNRVYEQQHPEDPFPVKRKFRK